MSEVECARCGSVCCVDGDFPKFFAWCDTCDDYADGFDCLDYAQDVYAGMIDAAHDRARDRRVETSGA